MLNKMQLTVEQKKLRKEWLQSLLSLRGFIISQTNGATYCFLPQFVGSKMFNMSFATLNSKDTYSRKYGEYIALSRMFAEYERILIPRDMVYYIEARTN